MGDEDARGWLRALFDASIDAVSAGACLAQHLPTADFDGRTVVIAAGKAAAAMAAVATAHFGPDIEGLVVYPPGHGITAQDLGKKLEIIEGGHPVPNNSSLAAATRALELARALGPKDRLIALISGGGSALLALPAQGITLGDKRALTKQLLASGATIAQMNCVRKHLSQIKGGRLALAAAPASVHTFLISDIPGDDPSLTASGPTLADTHTLADARAIVAALGIETNAPLADALSDTENETPTPDHPALAENSALIVARAADAFAKAISLGKEAGHDVIFLGDTLEDNAQAMGRKHAVLARQKSMELARDTPPSIAQADRKVRKPVLLLSGGETSVKLDRALPSSRGGRNLTYLLSLAIALDGQKDVYAIACDSDGIDGSSFAAGAIITPSTVERGKMKGLNALDMLIANQSHGYFEALGDLVVTGPTRTNVNDFRAILVGTR